MRLERVFVLLLWRSVVKVLKHGCLLCQIPILGIFQICLVHLPDDLEKVGLEARVLAAHLQVRLVAVDVFDNRA